VTTLAAKDDRLKTGRTGVRWRPAWRWPKETAAFVADLVRQAPGPSLHVCAGSSSCGDVRADMFHPAASVKADMYRLPFKDGAFGCVLADPPFPEDGIDLPGRLRQFQEMGRVCRSGGLVILHAPWLPSPTWAINEGVWWRETDGHAFPRAPVMISTWRVTGSGQAARHEEAVRRGRAAA
jgi:hypothetical protein